MKISIYLLTSNERLRRFAGTNKTNAVPKDVGARGFFKNHPSKFTLHAWTPKPEEQTATEFEKFLIGRCADSDAVLVLADQGWRKYADHVGDAVFVVPFDGAAAEDNPQNFFHKTSAQALRVFGQILAKFDRADDGELLALPLRNFHAKELAAISALFRSGVADSELSDAIETNLAGLRKRERPRKRSAYKNVYAVDDKGRFFIYGKERHSRFATGEPHGPSCELAGNFRFGRRIDAHRHYNVSETEGDNTSISGLFVDCHGKGHDIKRTGYLNMFPNDYF